ncbi:hypothetical protein JAAARDRAFT_138239 [Jaapia argillacea MUCL 33604]|uniref:Uncharacterized protein n=1 Tax=Jaapia argillacea MUCL 33604 TaxID=933084 RepID=A0A067PN00_9AGAM|nr:hypothetical protein JAAARDRAFT_138239 [Jaapia argillacea MUCL 33604]
MLPRSLILCSFLAYALGGTVTEGGSCSASDNHLEPASHKFLTDCDDKTFCSGTTNGTCVPRRCRADEFPYGFQPGDVLPSMCSQGSYCPDDGSQCVPLIAAGQPCEMNRDNQCAPGPDHIQLSSNQNFNGSICLQSTCMYANATLGQRCLLDNTTYIDQGPDGQQYANTVLRDDCHSPYLFCDEGSRQCFPAKVFGSPCLADRECLAYTCGTQDLCTDLPGTPIKVAPWQYAITVLCITAAMVAICVMLFLIHKRQRLRQYREIRDYYHEQLRSGFSIP